MSIVYLLSHAYEYGEENEHEEIKILGIYSTEANAEAAIRYYKDLRGFSKYPLSSFFIESFRMDVNAGWRGGFCNADDIDADFDKLAQCFTEWTEGRYTLFEDVYNSPLLNEVHSILSSRNRMCTFVDKLRDAWYRYFPHIRYGREDLARLADKLLAAVPNRIERCTVFEDVPDALKTFFHLCRNGTARQIRDALDAGAEVDARDDDGRTALMWAARDNMDIDAIKALLDAGADVDARDDDGRTALMWAARDNTDINAIEALLDAGADIDARDVGGRTALMWAAKCNSDKFVNALIDAGADIHMRDDEGRSIADYAQENRKIESTETLRRLWA